MLETQLEYYTFNVEMKSLVEATMLANRLATKNKVVYCVIKRRCGSYDVCKATDLRGRKALYTTS